MVGITVAVRRALAATVAAALALGCNTRALSPRAGPTRGRVVDCVTRAPLGGATYSSSRTSSAGSATTYHESVGPRATTFADGTFERYSVGLGSDRLDFSMPGYKPRVVFIPAGQAWTDVCLVPQR